MFGRKPLSIRRSLEEALDKEQYPKAIKTLRWLYEELAKEGFNPIVSGQRSISFQYYGFTFTIRKDGPWLEVLSGSHIGILAYASETGRKRYVLKELSKKVAAFLQAKKISPPLVKSK